MRGIIIACLLAAPAVAAAEPDGLTVEVKAGAGVLAYKLDPSGTSTDPAPLAIQLGAGGFVTPHLALTGQLVTTTALHNAEGIGTKTVTSYWIGPGVQVWLAPVFWVGAGAGLASVSYMSESQDAFGVSARAGLALPARGHNSWSVVLGGTSTVGADHDWVTGSLLLGYQYL